MDYIPVHRFFPFQTAFLPRILHPNQSWWFCRPASSHWCTEWHLQHPLGYNTFTVKECTLDFKHKTYIPFTRNNQNSRISIKKKHFQMKCLSIQYCLAIFTLAKIKNLQNWQIIILTGNFSIKRKKVSHIRFGNISSLATVTRRLKITIVK